MRQKGIQRPANNRNGGNPPWQRRQQSQPRPGGGGDRKPAAGAQPPPRDRGDLSCVNCGRKGHIAAECRQEKKDFKLRPCLKCQKPGHLARDCKEPAVKLVGEAGAHVPDVAPIKCVMMCRLYTPCPYDENRCDNIETHGKSKPKPEDVPELPDGFQYARRPVP